MYPVEFIAGPLDGIETIVEDIDEEFICKVYLDEDGNVLKEPSIRDTMSITVFKYKLMRNPQGVAHTLGGLIDGRWVMVEERFWNWYHFYYYYSYGRYGGL